MEYFKPTQSSTFKHERMNLHQLKHYSKVSCNHFKTLLPLYSNPTHSHGLPTFVSNFSLSFILYIFFFNFLIKRISFFNVNYHVRVSHFETLWICGFEQLMFPPFLHTTIGMNQWKICKTCPPQAIIFTAPKTLVTFLWDL